MGNAFLGAKTPAKVGIIFDWNNFWSYEYVAGISQEMDYVGSILDYYRQFYERNIPTDIISVDDDFSQYDLVVAPVLYMVKPGLAGKINDYVADGGSFVTTYMSGMVNTSDNIYTGGYPGPLSDVLGIWVEETDAIVPGKSTKVVYDNDNVAEGHYLCDLIHLTSDHAQAIAKYGSEFYAGVPAVTVNAYGNGQAWYVGSRLDHDGLGHLIDQVIQKAGVQGLITTPTDLEITKRVNNDGQSLYFVLNMRNENRQLPDELVAGWTDLLTGQQPDPHMNGWDLRILVHD